VHEERIGESYHHSAGSHGLHLSVGWKCRGMSRVRRLTDHKLKVDQAIAGRHGWPGDPVKHYAQCRRAKFEAGLMN
jgi:hypothetical protein